ncbi:MAG: hypothetical protein FJ386_13440 [Verrucomicrobia bacterium]|nr:hypothetical protein [Verrucomicrobiota bacterium]
MEESVAFGSVQYWVMLALLVFARGMDFLSTWIATPNLLLEANPIARKLGWRWGAVFNAVICVLAAAWTLAAIVVSTTSLLVAARNFKSAWFMRVLGEDRYRAWVGDLIDQAGIRTQLVCLLGETSLTAFIGAAVVYFGWNHLVLLSIGVGIVAYAGAVAFYTLLSLWRSRSRIG